MHIPFRTCVTNMIVRPIFVTLGFVELPPCVYTYFEWSKLTRDYDSTAYKLPRRSTLAGVIPTFSTLKVSWILISMIFSMSCITTPSKAAHDPGRYLVCRRSLHFRTGFGFRLNSSPVTNFPQTSKVYITYGRDKLMG